MSNYTFAFQKSQRRIAQILEALAKQPMTRDEVQCLLGIGKKPTLQYLRHLSTYPKRIYVTRWAVTEGPRVAVYAVGNRPDAQKPRPLTDKERAKKEWARIKADGERYDKAKAAARVRIAISRVRRKPQGIFAVLGI